jgi:hypothetical protein
MYIMDYALGKNGIVVAGAFIEPAEERGASHDLKWDWMVLYDDGEMMGADTNDLQEIKDD